MSNRPQSNQISVSVIIPALNEETNIARCLNSLNNQDCCNIDLEIIVVDNASTDKTAEIAQRLGAKVLFKKNGTIASLRNHGAESSAGEYLAFLDADCIPPGDWLSRAIPELLDDDRLVLGYRLSIPSDSNWVAKCWDLVFIKRYFTANADWIPSANMIMHRQAFFQVAGFDESLQTNEDYDLCFRLKAKGFNIISSSATAVTNLRPPRTLTEIFKKEIWHGKEVSKVFITDLVQQKTIFFFKCKNFTVILYAILYLFAIISTIITLLLFIMTGTLFPLLLSFFIPVIISFALALNRLSRIKTYKMLFPMTCVLIVYGLARAFSLLQYDSLKYSKIREEI